MHEAKRTQRNEEETDGELTSSVVVHGGLGKHGVVLELGLAEGWAVGGDEHKLGCTETINPQTEPYR